MSERRWSFVLKTLDKRSDSFATEPSDTEPVTYLLGGAMVNFLVLYPTTSKINGRVEWNSTIEGTEQAGFEVITAVLMKCTITWGIMPCACRLFHDSFLLGLLLDSEDVGDIFLWNVG